MVPENRPSFDAYPALYASANPLSNTFIGRLMRRFVFMFFHPSKQTQGYHVTVYNRQSLNTGVRKWEYSNTVCKYANEMMF